MSRKEIEITLEDVQQLMDDQFNFFEQVTSENVFCGNCFSKKGSVGMHIQWILLTSLNDIVAKGTCMVCGGPVSRYLETGENPDFSERADKFRKNRNSFSGLAPRDN